MQGLRIITQEMFIYSWGCVTLAQMKFSRHNLCICRLRDDAPLVRKSTLRVLTHLILNDMIKVKGQISELAICIVDYDERICGLSKLFFHELARKVTPLCS